MWFKNVQLYTFSEALNLSAEQIHQALEKHAFTPISQLQESTFGWVPSFKDSELQCENVQGRLFITAQVQEKILPASVLNDYLTEKLDEIEEAEGRRPGRKEREQLKEDLRAQLLPKAFHKTRRISAWIDPGNRWLVINASSEKSADDFTAQLREALGSLPVLPFAKSANGAELLTSWFIDATQVPDDFMIESDLELTLAQDSTVKAKYKNLDLSAPEITHSLEAGMRIRQMALSLTDRCQFVLNEKLHIKRIKFLDTLIEKAADSEDPRTDAILMSETITDLLKRLEPLVQVDSI
ncbi:MAG: recombination-associated protein RdgC [Reinekea sp.]|jgi:recombination associated protein RdgC